MRADKMNEPLSQAIQRWETNSGAPRRDSQQGPARLHPEAAKDATFYPSVWRKTDCRSHFWFTEGRVIWCAPSTVRPYEFPP